jgi:hypothetical protein
MSTDQLNPSARRTVDWGIAGTRALFVAVAIAISVGEFLLVGLSLAWVAITVVVPAALVIALDRVVRAAGRPARAVEV